MITRHAAHWFGVALAALFLCALFAANDASTQTPTGKTPDIKTAGGITTITFSLAPGKLALHLPDDMRAGDTISGTVVADPKGQTPEERAKNGSLLVSFPVIIDGTIVQPFSGSPTKEREPVIQQTFWIYTTKVSGRDGSLPVAVADRDGQTLAQTTVLMGQMFDEIRKAGEGKTPSGAVITPDPKITQPTHPSGAIITPDPKITNPPFTFPPVGQTGRNIVITGPFDGNGLNTELTVSDGEDRDTMGRFDVVAESPRKAVFAAPSNLIGPTTMHLTEGNTKATGSYRNVAVNLSAPKTNLLRGERTTLTVEVSGLAGIKKDVPLQLDATGVILMDGGNFQNLRITPTEVKGDGKYLATRAITGQLAGGFTVVATVIVSRFDVCIVDDSNRNSGILWNTFSGNYFFINPVYPPSPSGQRPSGGTSLTGTGKPVMKGCIITLTHNAPDRRVFAKLDACTKSGEATVQTTSPPTNVTITDKNVTDNSFP